MFPCRGMNEKTPNFSLFFQYCHKQTGKKNKHRLNSRFTSPGCRKKESRSKGEARKSECYINRKYVRPRSERKCIQSFTDKIEIQIRSCCNCKKKSRKKGVIFLHPI